MKIYLQLIGLIIVIALLSACEKKELPAPKYERGDVVTAQVDMGTNYKNQIWFSLEKNKIVSTNYKTDWDLAFESSSAGWHVIVNTGKSVKACKTTKLNLSQVTDTVGTTAGLAADMPSGNLDSTAIGDWQTNNTVYVIDRGYTEMGQHQGFYKLKLLTVSASQFTFEYGDISGTQTFQGTAVKDNIRNFVYYSFTSHQQVVIEPAKDQYDLCFTQYSHVFHNPFQYYQVTGVLSNSYNTRVAAVNDKAFNDISINDTLGRQFSVDRNRIGYEWKVFDLNTNQYTVDVTKCYIINDSKGFYYKLHFIDFYNDLGIRGYPKIEFRKL